MFVANEIKGNFSQIFYTLAPKVITQNYAQNYLYLYFRCLSHKYLNRIGSALLLHIYNYSNQTLFP